MSVQHFDEETGGVQLVALKGEKVRQETELVLSATAPDGPTEWRLPIRDVRVYDGTTTRMLTGRWAPRAADGTRKVVYEGGIFPKANFPWCDIRHWGIFPFRGTPLVEVVAGEGTTFDGVEDLGGFPCYVLSFPYPDGVRSSVWVDPAHGYRIRKHETHWKDGSLISRCEVEEFVEAREDIWLAESGT